MKLNCSRCRKWLDTKEFYKVKTITRGFSYYCKLCTKKRKGDREIKDPVVDRLVTCRDCHDTFSVKEYETMHAEVDRVAYFCDGCLRLRIQKVINERK